MPYNAYVPMGASFAQQPMYQRPQPQQQQQQQGMSPMQGMNMYEQFAGGGASGGAVGMGDLSVTGSPGAMSSLSSGGTMASVPMSSGAAAAGSGGGMAGGAASGAAGGGGGGMAAAGPWAALAAVIMANESNARKGGRRDEDSTSRGVDMFSGAVLEQDADYYGDKVGGPFGQAIKTGGQLGNPEGVFNFGKKGVKTMFKPWEMFS